MKLKFGIICGSGLSNIAKEVEKSKGGRRIPLSSWSCFVPGTTEKLKNTHFVFGQLNKKGVLVFTGRYHIYEGFEIKTVPFPILLFKKLGINNVIVTNAAGALNPQYNVGDMMLIADHVNIPGMTGLHPLRGPNNDELGKRFPVMSDCYSLPLMSLAYTAATDLKLLSKMQTGTYVFLTGPSYETAAEAKFLLYAGCDAVGMSTVPETLMARYLGMNVLGISMITNKVVTDRFTQPYASHEEVLRESKTGQEHFEALIFEIIRRYDEKDCKGCTNPELVKNLKARKNPIKTLQDKVSALENRSSILMNMVLALAFIYGPLMYRYFKSKQ